MQRFRQISIYNHEFADPLLTQSKQTNFEVALLFLVLFPATVYAAKPKSTRMTHGTAHNKSTANSGTGRFLNFLPSAIHVRWTVMITNMLTNIKPPKQIDER